MSIKTLLFIFLPVFVLAQEPVKDLTVGGKITLTSEEKSLPKKNGSAGDRLILAPGNATNEPYALGLNQGLFWFSVPPGSDFSWFTGGDLGARLDHRGTFELFPRAGGPGLNIDSTNNGDGDRDWDLTIANQKAPPVHRLAGFRLSDDGHLEASNKIAGVFEDGISNVSARLSFSGWTSLSDVRAKKEIKPLTNSLALVGKLKPVTFKFKWQQSQSSQPGFIAQDVEGVLPSLVEDDGKLKTLNYAALTPVAIAAIQEQQLKIEKLSKTNIQLEKRLSKLEKLLEKK